jgi:hypothetical protein
MQHDIGREKYLHKVESGFGYNAIACVMLVSDSS